MMRYYIERVTCFSDLYTLCEYKRGAIYRGTLEEIKAYLRRVTR